MVGARLKSFNRYPRRQLFTKSPQIYNGSNHQEHLTPCSNARASKSAGRLRPPIPHAPVAGWIRFDGVAGIWWLELPAWNRN